ncbi:class I SAM-dependent methyltransferase [Vibrio amylolyticus]|uniref:class I SAM-dependent methyltransferase n=1 Tax=Vibrio amylolyticus TaxID=2847292 RepID=UPI003551B4BA
MSKWDNVADKVTFNLEISISDLIGSVPLDSKILDFGCGYGRISKQLNAVGYSKTVGVDTSKEMINRGRVDYPFLDLRHLESNQLPFADNEFDAVITCAVFTCIPCVETRKQILAELSRILKPNGIIYLAEFSSPKNIKFTSGQGVPMLHSSQKNLEELLTQFTVNSSRVVNVSTMSGDNSYACHIIARKII